MKIVIITQGLSRIVSPLLESDHEICGIVESGSRQRAGNSPARESLLTRASRRFRGRLALVEYCRKKRIPYLLLWRRNMDECKRWLEALAPDLVVVSSMSQLLPPDILCIPNRGTVNLHPSLLPAYRGPNPWFWMYYNMEPVGGVTLHYLDASEDTGDIIDQRSFPFPRGARLPEMQDIAIEQHGIPMLLQAIDTLEQGGELPRTKQSPASPTARARNIKAGEHQDLIDWDHWPIERVWHVLRGTERWLNAIEQPSGIHAGKRWRVLDYEKRTAVPASKDSGRVHKHGRNFVLRCRDGVVHLKVHQGLRGRVTTFLRKPFS